MRVVVATYNVKSLRGGIDAVRAVIEPEGVDVLLVQEAGRKTKLRALAKALRMDLVSSHRLFSRVRNGVLFRPPWRLSSFDAHEFARHGRSLRRGMIAAHLRSPEGPLTAVSAHLGLVPRERVAHAHELTDRLLSERGPVVVGADLNEAAGAPAARWIAERLFDVAGATDGLSTFPAAHPNVRIDHLFVTEELRAERVWVADREGVATASDHRPLVAELDLRG